MLERFRVDGKLAVLTGGSRGIGFAIAEALAEAGASVILASRNADEAAAAAARLGPAHLGVAADVTSEHDRQRLFRIAAERGGCGIFVHAAGTMEAGFAAQSDAAQLQRMLDVHYLAAVAGAQQAGAQMRGHGGGAILFVSSLWGHRGVPGTLGYGAAKAALSHAVKVMALEGARDGIRVNGLAPGWVETAMTESLTEQQRFRLRQKIPLDRPGEPWEMALPALLALSPAGSYLTGQVLFVDGGESAR